MSIFKQYDKTNAPTESKPLLEAVEKKWGFAPNLIRTLAESPTALGAYLSLADLVEKSTFSPTEQQIILLSVSLENNCGYCVAAHSTIAKNMLKIDPSIVTSLRKNEKLADPKLNALSTFTRLLVKERGFVSETALNSFFQAGYNPRQALDVIVGVGMKTISNYVNHLAKTPIDSAFSAET